MTYNVSFHAEDGRRNGKISIVDSNLFGIGNGKEMLISGFTSRTSKVDILFDSDYGRMPETEFIKRWIKLHLNGIDAPRATRIKVEPEEE